MKLTTIALATAFALSTSLAFAQAGRNDAGATAPEHSATTAKHKTAKHHSHKKHMAHRQSGPGREPGAPNASRPGGKGVSKKPAEPRLPNLPSIPG